MPFKLANIEKEKQEYKDFLNKHPELIPEHERRMREYEFRAKLAEARYNKRCSQKEIGEKTGLSQQAISRIETGAYSTSLSNIMKYLNALGYTLDIVPIKKQV